MEPGSVRLELPARANPFSRAWLERGVEKTMSIRISFPGGKRVDADLGTHVIKTDQSVAHGGDGEVPFGSGTGGRRMQGQEDAGWESCGSSTIRARRRPDRCSRCGSRIRGSIDRTRSSPFVRR